MDNNVNLSPSWEDRNAQQGSILQKLHSVQKLVGHIFSFHFGQSSTQKTTFVYNLIVQWAIIFDFKVLSIFKACQPPWRGQTWTFIHRETGSNPALCAKLQQA
jgi:hypothetical protein